jgi:opacity protein-like surface antigen
MGKKLGLLMLLFSSLLALAQDTPKFEVFGGYSYANASRLSTPDRRNMNGWNASLTGNFNQWVGIVGDVSGYYGSSGAFPIALGACLTSSCVFTPIAANAHSTVHTFLFGPQVSWRRSGVIPFAHVLLGAGHQSLKITTNPPLGSPFHNTSGGFAMALGGGVDIPLTDRLALRFQPDYLQTRFFRGTQDNFRVSTGLVFRFK